LQYDVVISGELLDGFTIEQVKQNLFELLQLTEKKITNLLEKEHTLFASGLDFDKASEHVQQFYQAGLVAYLTRQGGQKQGASTSSTAATETPRVVIDETRTATGIHHSPFSFTGSGTEYFRIWIVNLVLTILTLGIYSAWAKVRNQQYFYGNTLLENASFVYTASPLQILKGRLLAFSFFVAYLLLSHFVPASAIVFALVFMVAFPWLVCRSLAFNAWNSEYRNVRFGFDGRYGQAATAFILWPVLGMISLGLLMPYAFYKQQSFMVSQHRYGDTSFRFEAGASTYYVLFLTLIGFAVVAGIILSLLTAAVPVELRGIAMIVMMFMSYCGVFVIFSAKSINIRFNNSKLGPHGFKAMLTTSSYFWLVLSNTLGLIVTLGLFYPWAKVRVATYMAEHIQMRVEGDLDQFSAQTGERVSALGEGVSDVFDVDIGL
jgi:uncharacterized membrane protein YjgN (DUF898 family)